MPVADTLELLSSNTAELFPIIKLPFSDNDDVPSYINVVFDILPTVYVDPAVELTVKLLLNIPFEVTLNNAIFCPSIFIFPFPLKVVVPSR